MNVNNLPPFKFKPYLKEVIWGGDRIARFKGLRQAPDNLGESWEISAIKGKESTVADGPDEGLTLSQLIDKYGAELVGKGYDGESFPLLIKLIDARHDLSLQVHPGDEMARSCHGCSGKTEMWYIIDNDPEARIYAGFKKEISPEHYRSHVADGSIVDDILIHPSEPGSVFFLPPGRIHAIGAGNFLIEVQQSSDVTYRVFDYNRPDSDGRPRELHIDRACEALDFKATPEAEVLSHPEQSVSGILPICSCQYFRVSRITVEGTMQIDMTDLDAFVTVTVIAGAMRIKVPGQRAVKLSQGETALIPASAQSVTLKGNAIAVTSTVPH